MTQWAPLANRLSVLAFAGMAGVAASASAETFPADQIEFFEKNIRPVLAELLHGLPMTRLQAVHTAVENFDFRGGEGATRALAKAMGSDLGG